ncbi:hypothetical protein MJT46_013371 [Ovis ammon polii x Ovis aries]|nr:hypothetical protein MJT46_013371 [Ovis ammon polii x Ovis aries]
MGSGSKVMTNERHSLALEHIGMESDLEEILADSILTSTPDPKPAEEWVSHQLQVLEGAALKMEPDSPRSLAVTMAFCQVFSDQVCETIGSHMVSAVSYFCKLTAKNGEEQNHLESR